MQIKIVWPPLALGIVMAMPGFAIAHAIAPTTGTMPTIGVALSRPEAMLQQDFRRVRTTALQYENTGTGRTLSNSPNATRTPTQFSGAASSYALVLSSLGMVGLISLLRLTRSLSMRTT